MNHELLDNLLFTLDDLIQLEDATVNNELIAEYYEAKQMNYRAENIRNCGCSTFWSEYSSPTTTVFDLQNVFLCHDPFCINCQRLKARTRVLKFSPVIEKVSETHDLYLLTITQTNVTSENYKKTLHKMPRKFAMLNNYLSGYKRIRGIDFDAFGYAGAVRAIETTFNEEEYHPHIHALIAGSKDFYQPKYVVNDYSYSYKTVIKDGRRTREKETRKFCELEILIQKIWYLLMNDTPVTKKNIETVELGYSCSLDRADQNSVLEVFKYSIKSFGEDTKHLQFEQFETILDGITNRRMIETYGVFREIIDAETIDQDIVTSAYDEIITALRMTCKTKYNVYKPIYALKNDLLEGSAIHINRKSIFRTTEETRRELNDMTYKIIADYNETHRKKINPDEFFEYVRREQDERKHHFEYLAQVKKDKQKKYTERSKARTRWVKKKMREAGKSHSDPRYRHDFLMAKVEWNNEHPLPSRKVNSLPF